MPQGARRLLGLGFKFCTLRARSTNRINNTIKRVKEDVRMIAFFKVNPPEARKWGALHTPTLH